MMIQNMFLRQKNMLCVYKKPIRAGFDGIENTWRIYGYITNNINHIDFTEYERKGYYIRSGSIECGNKLVHHQRLKQAGMRWNASSAQALLTFKTKAESSLWHIDIEIPVYNCF